MGGQPHPNDLRPDRPLGPSINHPSPVCETCPLHLEGEEWKDKLFYLGGRPLVCNGIKKRNGCGGDRARTLKITRFRSAIERYLAEHPGEAAAYEGVKA